MTFQAKLALVGIIGLCIMFMVCVAGCGGVELMPQDDGGTAGAGDVTPDAGTDVLASRAGAGGHDGVAGGAGVSGAAGAAGGAGGALAGRPLGAGCTDDTDCGSGICAKASLTDTTGVCCDGRPDACNTCMGGYKTAVNDGPVACGVCEHGTLLPMQDGTACGSSCAGPKMLSGFGPTATYQTLAVNSTCHAGVCVPVTTDCSTMTCPAGCMKQYLGCLLNVMGGDGFNSPGAACFCVGTNGDICHQENTRQDCRDNGQIVIGGSISCRDDGYAADPTWGTCMNGKVAGTQYAGLSCPFDVAAEYTTMPTCPGASMIGDQNTQWCAWQNTTDTIYCCDGSTVRKIARYR